MLAVSTETAICPTCRGALTFTRAGAGKEDGNRVNGTKVHLHRQLYTRIQSTSNVAMRVLPKLSSWMFR